MNVTLVYGNKRVNVESVDAIIERERGEEVFINLLSHDSLDVDNYISKLKSLDGTKYKM